MGRRTSRVGFVGTANKIPLVVQKGGPIANRDFNGHSSSQAGRETRDSTSQGSARATGAAKGAREALSSTLPRRYERRRAWKWQTILAALKCRPYKHIHDFYSSGGVVPTNVVWEWCPKTSTRPIGRRKQAYPRLISGAMAYVD